MGSEYKAGAKFNQQGQNSLFHYLNKMKVLMLLSVLQITFGLGVGKTYLVDTASSGSSELTGGCRGPGNVWYKKGDSFRSSDGCNTCFCVSGGGDGYACTKKACPEIGCFDETTGEYFQSGQEVPSSDCNTCFCSGGTFACTVMGCPEHYNRG